MPRGRLDGFDEAMFSFDAKGMTTLSRLSADALRERAKIKIDVTNVIPEPPAIALTLRGAQYDAVPGMLRHDTGVLVSPPGFGRFHRPGGSAQYDSGAERTKTTEESL